VLAVLTTGRQDYGILRSTLVLLRQDPRFSLQLWVGGMHLKERFGLTVDLIRRDAFEIGAEHDFLAEPPEPVQDTARATSSVGRAVSAVRPEALVLVGDRSETLAAGLAASIAGIPIVHLHGGEESEGAIDNAMRHALTKLSHLHLVSHPLHAHRVIQMGEDPSTVIVVGAPGLDNLYRADLPDRTALEQELRCSLAPPVVLVTMHPTTLGEDPEAEVGAVASAMEQVNATYIITQPNADAGGTAILSFWKRWVHARSRTLLVDALGDSRYWGLLRIADAVLGNSSSGIIEAPNAGVPTINVGDRQRGRLRHPATRDVPAQAVPIATALRIALRPGARADVAAAPPVYPVGPAAPRIIEALAAWHPDMPPRKRFRDLEWTGHR
jgi:UDP-hydrolysing UDP-N-acetyl-D-glucosamine 2-epimerase